MVELIRINGIWCYDEPGFPYYCGDETQLYNDDDNFDYTVSENELEELIDQDSESSEEVPNDLVSLKGHQRTTGS